MQRIRLPLSRRPEFIGVNGRLDFGSIEILETGCKSRSVAAAELVELGQIIGERRRPPGSFRRRVQPQPGLRESIIVRLNPEQFNRRRTSEISSEFGRPMPSRKLMD